MSPLNTARTLSIALAALSLGLPLAMMTACGGGGGAGTLPPIAPAPAEASADAGAAAATSVKAPGDAKVGDTAHCPVSGEEFVVTDSSPHADVNGKTYYFCCAGCEKKFLSNPQKFTGEKTKS